MIQETLAGAMAATTGLTAPFIILTYRSKTRGELWSEHIDRQVEPLERILNAWKIREKR